ncbi:NAD-dependent epimerase/dehydratase family protein [Microbacterium immunditiarum]|uniref:Nucleoside-diphosphate-sugar epimerase n=1 Tax=Microbacterium immunditiarum TaxID=337480 RepID=A0A7Y9GPC1_9MICO|nr:nucleoside-diphosphate-sugar epimerase [Microbacterium immunditiarum]
MNTHVVLGGNGSAGRATVAALIAKGLDVVSVSRTSAAPSGARSAVANLLDLAQTRAAVDRASVVYLAAGLPYSTKAWRAQWPVVMRNTIAAARDSGAHLVFLDNVYPYGQVDGPMTEQTPYRPTTGKGRLRLELIRMLQSATDGGFGATIVRSADFYGPGVATSVFNTFVIDNVVAGKPPVWMFDASHRHSMTFVPDLGEALALVGTTPAAQGRTWHAPTATPALTGEQLMLLATGGARPVRTMSRFTVRLGGLFVPTARETLELSYQNTSDYVFDSSAIERELGLVPTSYEEGIARSLKAARSGASAAAR